MNFLSFNIIVRLRKSRLFQDSFWAVAGNAIGSALMLFAGIFIARFLGKDLYGEYGVVKSTMFYIGSFAALGLGFTTTKYIAEYVHQSPQFVRCVVRDGFFITFITSAILAGALIIWAHPLAIYLGEPDLALAFQILGIIIVVRAWITTQTGILAGLKSFKGIAKNNLYTGIFMLVICIPFTYFWGLKGALGSLLFSQIFNAAINYLLLHKELKSLPPQKEKKLKKELFLFSFPVALAESSYSICNWLGMMILVKYSSAGELGIYSACAQWVAIILFIPGMLFNVVLSHLSTHSNDSTSQKRTMKIMLLTNFASTALPFIAVLFLASFISSFYGPTFSHMPPVLTIFVCSTIFTCCSNVFRAEFTALGRNWLMLWIRVAKDIFFLGLGYYMIRAAQGHDGAYIWAEVNLYTSILYIAILVLTYWWINKNLKRHKDVSKNFERINS